MVVWKRNQILLKPVVVSTQILRSAYLCYIVHSLYQFSAKQSTLDADYVAQVEYAANTFKQCPASSVFRKQNINARSLVHRRFVHLIWFANALPNIIWERKKNETILF